MINSTGEQDFISLSAAAQTLPQVNGRHPHPATIWRWARKGIAGVKLDTWRVGGRVVTTKAAIRSFLDAVGRSVTASHLIDQTEVNHE